MNFSCIIRPKYEIILVCLLLSIIPFKAYPQEEFDIKEIGWSITIPKEYSLTPLDSPKPPPSDAKLYLFKREPIKDENGVPIFPNIAIIIENIPENFDAVLYSINVQRRIKYKTKTLKYFVPSDSLFSINAFGTLIEYTEKWRERDVVHKVYQLYSVVGTKGIQVIMDCTDSVFKTVNDEFISTMKSIKSIK